MGPVASLNARRVSWYSFCQQVVRSTHLAHTLSAVLVKISAGFSVLALSGWRVSCTVSYRAWKAEAISPILREIACRLLSRSGPRPAPGAAGRACSFFGRTGSTKKTMAPTTASMGRPTWSPPSQLHSTATKQVST